MTGQWLPIVLAALPLVDLGFRLLLELIFSGVADFQLGATLHKDDRKKLTELVGNSALFKTIRVYFENAVRIRQVFPTVALATLSVWGAIQELAAKGTVSQTWNRAWKAYLAL